MAQDVSIINQPAETVTPDATDQATHWTIIPDRTSVNWTAAKRYLMVIPVSAKGSFKGATGTVEIDGDDPMTARVDLRAPAASQDSGMTRRDTHLQGSAFFDSANHPEITFRSTAIRRLSGAADRYAVTGQLGIKGVEYPVTLEGTWKPVSGGRARVELEGTVSRSALGLAWNAKPVLNLLDPIELRIDAELERVAH